MSRPPRSILVILDDCGPGDAAVVTPHLRALRAAFDGSRLVAVVAEAAAPVFEGSQLFDRLLVSRLYRPGDRRWRRLRKLAELARLALKAGTGYDLVIVLWWGSTFVDLLGFVAGAGGERIGYAHRYPRLLSRSLGAWDNGSDPIQQVVRALAAAGVESRHEPPEIPIADADRAAARSLLREEALAPKRLAVLHPGSDWACQQWEPARWARLADALAAGHGMAIAFTGAAREEQLVDSIRASMAAPAANLAGRTSIPVLAALLSMARLCVSVDCVTFELSQAVAVPTVVLAGPSQPDRVAQAGSPLVVVNRQTPQRRAAVNACKLPHFANGGCLDTACPMAFLREIEVADALEAVERVLALEVRENAG